MSVTLAELTEDLPVEITSLSIKPLVVEGVLHEMDFHFRYRAGTAVLAVGGERVAPLYRAEMEYGSDWSSKISPEEIAELLRQLIPQLTRSPRQWAFPSTDGGQQHMCWGMDADDAYQVLMESHRIAGLTPPAVLNVSYTIDDRVWPDPEPIFEV